MPMIDLRPAADELSGLIRAVPDGALGGPTPCSSYTVGDLVDHIAGLTMAFGGAAAKATGDTADMGPAGDASHLPDDWRDSVPARLDQLAQAWLDPGAWEGMTRVGGQDLPGEVAGTIAFGELVVHGWDLARATGLPFTPEPVGGEILFALVSQVFGSGGESARGTAFGPPVPVPDDAPLFDRTLGILGRDPSWSAPDPAPSAAPAREGAGQARSGSSGSQ